MRRCDRCQEDTDDFNYLPINDDPYEAITLCRDCLNADKPPMTVDELARYIDMASNRVHGDAENCHIIYDYLLLMYIKENSGSSVASEMFLRKTRWYA